MTVSADRIQEMTRDVIVGKPKSMVAMNAEEDNLWAQLVEQVSAIREAGMPDVPFEAEPMTYGQEYYRPTPGAPALVAAPPPIDPDAPPVYHFTDPQFSEPTAMQIENDGHIYGHLALWGTCHTTHTARSKCITPPHSRTGYGHFLTGQVLTREGRRLPVGVITLDTGHASEQFSMTRAISHYDDTGTAVADISIGEDKHGIWFTGSLRPGLTAKQVRALRASPLSGDWRERTATRGDLELVAALAVNVQGFPVPRPKGLVASGQMSTLVAAGMLPPKKVRREDVQSGALSTEDIRYLKSLAAREREQEENHRRMVLTDATSLKREMLFNDARGVALGMMREAVTEMATTLRATYGYNEGQWRDPHSGEWIDMPDQAIGKLMALVPDGDPNGDGLPELQKGLKDDIAQGNIDAANSKIDQVLKDFPFDNYDAAEAGAAKQALESFKTGYVPAEKSDLTGPESTDIGAGDVAPEPNLVGPALSGDAEKALNGVQSYFDVSHSPELTPGEQKVRDSAAKIGEAGSPDEMKTALQDLTIELNRHRDEIKSKKVDDWIKALREEENSIAAPHAPSGSPSRDRKNAEAARMKEGELPDVKNLVKEADRLLKSGDPLPPDPTRSGLTPAHMTEKELVAAMVTTKKGTPFWKAVAEEAKNRRKSKISKLLFTVDGVTYASDGRVVGKVGQ